MLLLPPPVLVITGLPGTGKTRLALELGIALMRSDHPALVLHTDVLKVTLRQFYPDRLNGAGYTGDFYAKAACVRSFLETQVTKATGDRYTLIIEGTLALGFHPTGAVHIHLDLADEIRKARVRQKHRTAQTAIAAHSLQAYHDALIQQLTPDTLRLDAALPPDTLVEAILPHLNR